MDLFDDGAAPDEGFSINQSYAERYHHNKRRIELEQLKEKYGDNAEEDEETDSSEDVTEDEDGEQLTPQVDAAILRTLQRIREKDSEIYDSSNRIFDTERQAVAAHEFPAQEQSSRSKKITLRDYQRGRMMEAMKESDDPAKAFAEATMHQASDEMTMKPTHDDEQEALRSEFLQAAEDADEPADDLFQVRKVDGDDDEVSYRAALLGALDNAGDETKIRNLLKDSKASAQESQNNDDFLLNFVLNRGWVENEDGASVKKRDWDAEAEELESEASFESAADAFEQAYNFRFEDPSLAQKNFAIESFPRHTEESIRRKDDRRVKARQERAARKKEEKEQKMRELDQLKSLKRQEIAEKLKKLREVSGGDNKMDDLAFEDIDLEADFDPAEHDRMMQRQFNDDYYSVKEKDIGAGFADADIDEIIASESKPAKSKNRKQVSAEIEMDADFENGESVKLSKKERKALKKKEKKAKNKASHNENGGSDIDMDAEKADATLSETDRKQCARELMDEYYNLGYEDMIGDTPTRFKYAAVPKETFGLSAVEILMADDADLNNVVGLKHYQPYRRGSSRPSNLKKRLKRFRDDLGAKESEESVERPKKKRLGKKERQKLKAQNSGTTESS